MTGKPLCVTGETLGWFLARSTPVIVRVNTGETQACSRQHDRRGVALGKGETSGQRDDGARRGRKCGNWRRISNMYSADEAQYVIRHRYTKSGERVDNITDCGLKAFEAQYGGDSLPLRGGGLPAHHRNLRRPCTGRWWAA
jgi:hypothetical protein